MTAPSVVYHGYLFDASGYGRAARAYVHALHGAGVDVAAVDLARRAPQVRDPLVESLAARAPRGDVHLFHGIPTHWARQAFRRRDAIGMTVWETDQMPSQWRGPLNQVADVWLPCEFNVAVFAPALERPVFRLPHPVFPPVEGLTRAARPALPGVADGDFVVYAVFEWQDRKHPHGMLDAFLRAFRDADDAVLVLKTNPGAADVARQALAAARAQTGSDARVLLHAEGWDEARLAALHARGDCYLSLHRGEGWGYPLFEAAARGTPVVATAHAGPLDYLRADDHALVRHRPTAVRQPYAFYHPRMCWAEPDVAHAAELLRAAYDDREGARARARRGAARIREEFSLARVGEAAHERLVALRRRLGAPRTLTIVGGRGAARTATASHAHPRAAPPPPLPVPASWYDADYFEHGVTSNWGGGYRWDAFAGLFRDTAAWLADCFPDARTVLDAGCAKGFLVRALRERGVDAWGVDHSAWAVERAEPAARPFVSCADVAALPLDREFDLVVALDLLSHLTEAQAEAFLRRARDVTRVALVATVPPGLTAPPGDRDTTHVTRRPREWWRALFLRAGWRHDAIVRLAEDACARAPLPTRMGWGVHLVVPARSAAAAPAAAEA